MVGLFSPTEKKDSQSLDSNTLSFRVIDQASVDDLSDVEGDALEDFGFNETKDEIDNRFENELS